MLLRHIHACIATVLRVHTCVSTGARGQGSIVCASNSAPTRTRPPRSAPPPPQSRKPDARRPAAPAARARARASHKVAADAVAQLAQARDDLRVHHRAGLAEHRPGAAAAAVRAQHRLHRRQQRLGLPARRAGALMQLRALHRGAGALPGPLRDGATAGMPLCTAFLNGPVTGPASELATELQESPGTRVGSP